MTGWSFQCINIGIDWLGIDGVDAENHKRLCAALKPGDIVVFHVPGKRIIHRLAAITEENGRRKFWTKGDNNALQDQTVFGWEVYDENIEWLVLTIIYADRKWWRSRARESLPPDSIDL